MKKITQKEIADKLGLHVRTISRVLNHEESVRAKTRQRVVDELNRNGYFFQTHPHSEVVAIDIRPGYLEDLALRLIEIFSHRNMQFQMVNHTADPQHFYRVVDKSNIVVFCSTPSEAIIRETARRHPGIYRINLFSHGIPGAEVSIEPNNDALGKRSARYLAECGHKDIMVISSMENMAALERTKSFIGEMAVSFPAVHCRTIMVPLGFPLPGKLLSALKEANPLPTAIYCPGIYIAWQTCQAMSHLNYRVPEQISLLINDLPEEFTYQLPFRPDTVFSRISDVIGLAEFNIINRLMLKGTSSISMSLDATLQINGSVKKIK